MLASGSDDKTVKLWETRERQAAPHARRAHRACRNRRLLPGRTSAGLEERRSHDPPVELRDVGDSRGHPGANNRQPLDSRPRLSSHVAAAGHRRLEARHAGRRAIPADPPLGAGLRRAAGPARRGGGGRARGPSHDRQDRAGGRSQRGQIGAGLSPDPRRVQGAGFDARAAVLGVSRLGQAPRGWDGLRGDPLGLRGPARLPAGPRALRGRRRPGAGVVRCLGPPRPAARRGLLAQATPNGAKATAPSSSWPLRRIAGAVR